jgi:hypothetical protein
MATPSTPWAADGTLPKAYRTPAGSLWQIVRETDDYPDEVHLFSDRNVPAGRSKSGWGWCR